MTAVAPPPRFFSIDVECVATGTDHNAREVAQISLVVGVKGVPPHAGCSTRQPPASLPTMHVPLQDQHERVLLDLYVKPDKPVVSYLQPLTG